MENEPFIMEASAATLSAEAIQSLSEQSTICGSNGKPILFVGLYDFPYGKHAYIYRGDQFVSTPVSNNEFRWIADQFWLFGDDKGEPKPRALDRFAQIVACSDGEYKIL